MAADPSLSGSKEPWQSEMSALKVISIVLEMPRFDFLGASLSLLSKVVSAVLLHWIGVIQILSVLHDFAYISR